MKEKITVFVIRTLIENIITSTLEDSTLQRAHKFTENQMDTQKYDNLNKRNQI